MLDSFSSSWLRSGEGSPPELEWTFSTESPLQGMTLVRETGDVVAADTTGGLYQLDRQGTLRHLSRIGKTLHLLSADDAARHVAVVQQKRRLSLLQADFSRIWSVVLPETVSTLALDAYGDYLGVALSNGKNVVYGVDRRKVFHFETERPLRCLQFAVTQPLLFGAAEYGLTGCWDFSGEELWIDRRPSHVGGLSCTGDGRSLFTATFREGIRQTGEGGLQQGAFLLEGTPRLVSVSFTGHRLAAATLEGQLYWMNGEGDLLGGVFLPEELQFLQVTPLGDGLVCGFQSGRVVQLLWES